MHLFSRNRIRIQHSVCLQPHGFRIRILKSRSGFGLIKQGLNRNIHARMASFIVVSRTHYNDVIMTAMASPIASLTIVNSTVYSGADQRKHQSSASLAFARGIHRWPVNILHKWPVTRKMFPFDDVIMLTVASGCIRIRFAKPNANITTWSLREQFEHWVTIWSSRATRLSLTQSSNVYLILSYLILMSEKLTIQQMEVEEKWTISIWHIVATWI